MDQRGLEPIRVGAHFFQGGTGSSLKREQEQVRIRAAVPVIRVPGPLPYWEKPEGPNWPPNVHDVHSAVISELLRPVVLVFAIKVLGTKFSKSLGRQLRVHVVCDQGQKEDHSGKRELKGELHFIFRPWQRQVAEDYSPRTINEAEGIQE
jgi:hypothetical protein